MSRDRNSDCLNDRWPRRRVASENEQPRVPERSAGQPESARARGAIGTREPFCIAALVDPCGSALWRFEVSSPVSLHARWTDVRFL
jgi:hypothetical protein